jgi:hypothetical protein
MLPLLYLDKLLDEIQLLFRDKYSKDLQVIFIMSYYAEVDLAAQLQYGGGELNFFSGKLPQFLWKSLFS